MSPDTVWRSGQLKPVASQIQAFNLDLIRYNIRIKKVGFFSLTCTDRPLNRVMDARNLRREFSSQYIRSDQARNILFRS